MSKNVKKNAFIVVYFLFVPVLVGLFLKATAQTFAPPGRLIDIGSHHLHIYCSGPESAQPTVIVEAGLGGPTPFYHWLQTDLEKTQRVCSYDRAGLGWSDPSDQPSDAESISDQLHVLLQKAGVKMPIVFAGHSYAGLITRLYADKYPEDVAGIVFIDASHPDQEALLVVDDGVEEDAPEDDNLIAVFKLLTELGLTRLYNPILAPLNGYLPKHIIAQLEALNSSAYYDMLEKESAGFAASIEQLQSIKNLGGRPVIAVTAGQQDYDETVTVDGQEVEKVWLKLQQDLAELSTNGKHVVVDGADHLSLIYDKQYASEVAGYVRQVTQQVATAHEF